MPTRALTIAVTGAAGAVGSAVVVHLNARGHRVIEIDRVGERPIDVTDYAATVTAVTGADVVVHLAAINTPDAREVETANNAAAANVMRACLELGIRRLVQASSVNAIGMAFSDAPQFDYFPIDTEHPARTKDAYSSPKCDREVSAAEACAEHPDFAVVSLRLHAVMADAAAARYQQTRSGDSWAIKGLWGYCTFESVVRAVELACTVPITGHEILLVVEPATFSPRRTAQLAREFHPGVPVRGRLWRRRSFFDTSRTERILGWRASSAKD